jgi:hypothetical protein
MPTLAVVVPNHLSIDAVQADCVGVGNEENGFGFDKVSLNPFESNPFTIA